MNIEQQAAATLLDKGIEVRVTAPLLFRVFGKRNIRMVLHPPCLGTMTRISEQYVSAGITPDDLLALSEADAHELFRKHGRWLSRVVALAWLYGKWRGRIFTGIVSGYIYWHMSSLQLTTAASVLTLLCSRESFTNSIRLVATMRTTAPNLSQKSQGS